MARGVDRDFIHYGIRHDDLRVIEAICNSQDIDFEWLKEEILGNYHGKRMKKSDISDDVVGQIIRSAIERVSK